MMERRRLLFPFEESLPSTYTQVSYIESTGTQYIDTGIIFNQGLRIETEMAWTEFSNTGANTIFGARTDTGATRYLVTDYHGIDYAYGTDRVDPMTIPLDYFYNILFDTLTENSFTYGADNNYWTAYQVPINTNTTGIIFGYHRASDDSIRNLAKAKCKSFIIKNNSSIIFNGIPCKRNIDQKPGMYDLISKTFLTNQGTGEFVTP